jgi:hypothetical protein
MSRRPFQDLTSTIPNAALVNETLVADFNGDLRNDIVMRGSLRHPAPYSPPAATSRPGSRRSHNSAAEKGFTFRARPDHRRDRRHYAKEYQPPYVLTLNPQGPSSGCGGGSFIGVICVSYDLATAAGRLLYNDYTLQAYVSITTVEPIPTWPT